MKTDREPVGANVSSLHKSMLRASCATFDLDWLRRHGDKAREMKLLSLKEYGQAAEKLTMHNPLTLKRAAFVSSEDPDVIRQAQRLTSFGASGAL